MSRAKCLFLVGGPGSGKDFLIRTLPQSIVELQLSKVFGAMGNQHDVEEINEGKGIIINGSAENLDEILATKMVLENMDYDTSMLFVFTTDEESKSRNDVRISRREKTISEETRQVRYNTCIENAEELENLFETFAVFDNTQNLRDIETDPDGFREINEKVDMLSDFVNEIFFPELNEGKTTYSSSEFDKWHKAAKKQGCKIVESKGKKRAIIVTEDGTQVSGEFASEGWLSNKAKGVKKEDVNAAFDLFISEDKDNDTNANRALASTVAKKYTSTSKFGVGSYADRNSNSSRPTTLPERKPRKASPGMSDYFSHNNKHNAEVRREEVANEDRERRLVVKYPHELSAGDQIQTRGSRVKGSVEKMDGNHVYFRNHATNKLHKTVHTDCLKLVNEASKKPAKAPSVSGQGENLPVVDGLRTGGTVTN